MLVANQAVVDGQVAGVEHAVSVVAANDNDGTIEIVIRVLFFENTLEYDPDVSVFFGDEGEDDDDDDTTKWLPLISLAIVPIALLVVIVVIVVAVLIRLRGKFQSGSSSYDTELTAVNYE